MNLINNNFKIFLNQDKGVSMLKVQFMSGHNGFNFTKFTVHLVEENSLTNDTILNTKEAVAICGRKTSNVGKIASMNQDYLITNCKKCIKSYKAANK